jgi:hypothetical protein
LRVARISKAAVRSEFMLGILSDESLRGWTDEELNCGERSPHPLGVFHKNVIR